MSREVRALLAGTTTSFETVKADVIRELVYKQAELLDEVRLLLPTKPLTQLDVRFQYPSKMLGQYPVAEGEVAGSENITWDIFGMTLERGSVHYTLTDQSKLRQNQDWQTRFSRERAVSAMEFRKTRNIIDAIVAGPDVNNTVNVAPGAEWDAYSATTNIVRDVTTAWNNVLANSDAKIGELRDSRLLVPANVFGAMQDLWLINNVQQRMSDYIKVKLGITIVPTRYTDQINHKASSLWSGLTGISDDAYLIIPVERCGVHGVLSPETARGANVPLVELNRIKGVGDDYLVHQFFNTQIIENSSSDATSSYIAQIANVT